jgi:hypothetical protein
VHKATTNRLFSEPPVASAPRLSPGMPCRVCAPIMASHVLSTLCLPHSGSALDDVHVCRCGAFLCPRVLSARCCLVWLAARILFLAAMWCRLGPRVLFDSDALWRWVWWRAPARFLFSRPHGAALFRAFTFASRSFISCARASTRSCSGSPACWGGPRRARGGRPPALVLVPVAPASCGHFQRLRPLAQRPHAPAPTEGAVS